MMVLSEKCLLRYKPYLLAVDDYLEAKNLPLMTQEEKRYVNGKLDAALMTKENIDATTMCRVAVKAFRDMRE